MTDIGTYRTITIRLDGRDGGTLYALTSRGTALVQVGKQPISTSWAVAYDSICRQIDRWLDGE